MPPALTAEQNQHTKTDYWGDEDKLLKKYLDKLGVEDDVKSYPDAGHSYMNNHDTLIFREIGDNSPMHAELLLYNVISRFVRL